MLIKFADLSQSNRLNWVMWQVNVRDLVPAPTKEIAIKFQIRLKYICLYLLLHLSDHKESCAVLGWATFLWLDQFSINSSEHKFHQIPIELSWVGRAPGWDACLTQKKTVLITRRSENDNTPHPLDQWTNSPFMGQHVENCTSFTLTHYLANVFAMHCRSRACPLCVQHCIQVTSISLQVNQPSHS